jgi:hypothetical protein
MTPETAKDFAKRSSNRHCLLYTNIGLSSDRAQVTTCFYLDTFVNNLFHIFPWSLAVINQQRTG